MRDRPDYRSYSQLDEWMKCGESFRLSRRVGLPEKPSVWLPGGTAFHNTTEIIDAWLMAGVEFGDADVQDAWLTQWQKAVLDQVAKVPDEYIEPSTWRAADKGKEDYAWWQNTGLIFCLKYVAWRRRMPLEIYEHGDTVLMEAELNPILSGVTVKMFPDRIMVDQHGQLIVVDLKTGKSDPSPLQLGVYKVGVEKLLGVTVEWGAFYKARKGELDLPVSLNHWTEDRIGFLFSTFDAQERAGQYLPSIGPHCKYMCSFKEHCVYVGGKRHPEDTYMEDN